MICKEKIIHILSVVFFVLISGINAYGTTNSTILEEVPKWIYPKPFKYRANDLPDPFIPFIKETPSKSIVERKKKGPLSPLEKISPTQLKLIGIMYSHEIEPLALVELPDKKSYILKKGTSIGQNGGYVATIKKDRVIIQEPHYDLTGNKIIKKIELKLHSSEGEKK